MSTILDTLITNRTLADVNRAYYLLSLWDQETCSWTGTEEELAEWNAGPPGLYLAKDLNRVEEAVEYVAGLLAESGCAVSVQVKKDWAPADIPSKAQMDRYLENLRTVRSALPLFAFTPQVPEDMDKLTYWEANNIEKIIKDTARAVQNKKDAVVYAGLIQSGMIASIPQTA